jgi:hypothetical protein
VNERIPKHQFDSRELWVMAGFFALVVVFAFPQMVFSNRSLVPSNNYNPLRLQRAFTKVDYGPDFIRLKEWTSRGIVPYTNYHDPAGSWLEGEPALIFFRDAVLSGQFPFWDPFVACGSPAYSNPAANFSLPIRCYFSNEKYLYFTAVLDSGVRDVLLPSYARSWNNRECGWRSRFFVFWRRSTGSTLNIHGPTDSDDSCNSHRHEMVFEFAFVAPDCRYRCDFRHRCLG